MFGEVAKDYVDAVAQKLDDPDHSVRLAAIKALGMFGEVAKDYVDAVAKKLDDPDYSFRLAAIKALGAFGKLPLRHVTKVVAKIYQEKVPNQYAYPFERRELGWAVGNTLKDALEVLLI